MTERVKSDDLTRSVIWGLTFPSNVLPYLVQFLFWPGQWRLIVGRHDPQEKTRDRLIHLWIAPEKLGKLIIRCRVLCLRAHTAWISYARLLASVSVRSNSATQLFPEATEGNSYCSFPSVAPPPSGRAFCYLEQGLDFWCFSSIMT